MLVMTRALNVMEPCHCRAMAQGNLISPCSASLGIVHRVFQTGPGSQHWAAMLEQLTVLVGPCGLTMRVAVGPWTLVAAWVASCLLCPLSKSGSQYSLASTGGSVGLGGPRPSVV